MEPVKHGTPLRADEKEMHAFLETIFRKCKQEKGWIALRGFNHDDETGKPAVSRWVAFGKGVVEAAVETASAIASRSFEQRAVFSPPVCIFGDDRNADGNRFAGERNVTCVPALVVDLDEHPVSSLAGLWNVLGQPTVIVASGGFFNGEPKMHVYWRLGTPARTTEEQAALRKARGMAARLVSADKSAGPLSHPMRWPGSWHTKGDPVLCRMTGDGDPSREIKLQWAVEALDEALMSAGITYEGRGALARPGHGFKTPVAWGGEDLMRVAELIPNEDMSWEDWNVLGMTFYDASHGSLEGLEAFEALSAKSSKDRDDAAAQRWRHYAIHPPTEVSEGKLWYEARKVDPDFVRVQDIAEIWFEQVETPPAPEVEPKPFELPASATASGVSVAAEAGVDDSAAPGYVRELNMRHAFVMNKGQAFVANIEPNGEVTFSKQSAFHDRYANKLIQDGKRKVPVADLWWAHPQRAQFLSGVDFDPNRSAPGVFNMWRGFPPVPGAIEGGRCDLILRHIREVICNGVERDFRYLIGWLAHILQKPGEKPEVAIVLRGKKGTGKDTLRPASLLWVFMIVDFLHWIPRCRGRRHRAPRRSRR